MKKLILLLLILTTIGYSQLQIPAFASETGGFTTVGPGNDSLALDETYFFRFYPAVEDLKDTIITFNFQNTYYPWGIDEINSSVMIEGENLSLMANDCLWTSACDDDNFVSLPGFEYRIRNNDSLLVWDTSLDQYKKASVEEVLGRDSLAYYESALVDTLQVTNLTVSNIDGETSDSSLYVRKNKVWADVKTAEKQSFRTPQNDLVYYKDDLIDAFYRNNSNVKILVLGDSFGASYTNPLRHYLYDRYGYGGGYEMLVHSQTTVSGYDLVFLDGSWDFGYDRDDAYNFGNRFAYSTNPTDVMKFSAMQFNEMDIYYKQKANHGTFEVKLNSETPDTIDTDGASAGLWWSKDWGDTTLTVTDTVYVTLLTDSAFVYGINLKYDDYTTSEHKPFEVGRVYDGGAPTSAFYDGKDITTMTTAFDSIDASLCLLVNLDSYDDMADVDSLVSVLQTIKPEMDIIIIAPQDRNTGIVSSEIELLEAIAIKRDVGFFNFYNYIGSYTDLEAVGAITDDVHLDSDYYWYTLLEYLDPILPKELNKFHHVYSNNLVLPPTNNTQGIIYQGYNDVFHNLVQGGTPFLHTYANTNTAGHNTFLGADAGNLSLTGAGAGSEGSYNTGIGYRNLIALTTGAFNTGVGANALFLATTGDDNTALGYSALSEASTGSDNTAVGSYSLAKLTERSGASSFGSYSGYSNTTGLWNSYLGAYAGRYNATGHYNTGVGYGALGGASGQNHSSNTGIGTQALTAVTTGGHNTVVGAKAGTKVTTGVNNTFIGSAAADNVTTGTNNIIIGYNVNPSAADATYELDIGGAIKGNLSTKDIEIIGSLDIKSDAPAAANSTGTAGTITWDADYIYICTATDTWKRVAISTW